MTLALQLIQKLTDCLEGPQPHVTRNTDYDNGSIRNTVGLCSDDYTDGDSEESGADDLKSRTGLLDAVPPRLLDDLLFDMVARDVVAGVGGHLHWVCFRHVLDILGIHCNNNKHGLSLKDERQESC